MRRGDTAEAQLLAAAVNAILNSMMNPQGEGIATQQGIAPALGGLPSGNGLPALAPGQRQVARPGPESGTPLFQRMTQ